MNSDSGWWCPQMTCFFIRVICDSLWLLERCAAFRPLTWVVETQITFVILSLQEPWGFLEWQKPDFWKMYIQTGVYLSSFTLSELNFASLRRYQFSLGRKAMYLTVIIMQEHPWAQWHHAKDCWSFGRTRSFHSLNLKIIILQHGTVFNVYCTVL